MNELHARLINLQQYFEHTLDSFGKEIDHYDQLNRQGWSNRAWTSHLFRIAHLNIVSIEQKNLWMMHCCIYPQVYDSSPIFGFDVFAGKNKITGCFHDFSPLLDREHPLILWFSNQVRDLQWKRTRSLPDWAEKIFSPYMLAIGNIQLDNELDFLITLIQENLRGYLDQISIDPSKKIDSTTDQNYYCQQQKLNANTPRVLANLGLTRTEIDDFINNYLFPEI